jgi:hypothetical protein
VRNGPKVRLCRPLIAQLVALSTWFCLLVLGSAVPQGALGICMRARCQRWPPQIIQWLICIQHPASRTCVCSPAQAAALEIRSVAPHWLESPVTGSPGLPQVLFFNPSFCRLQCSRPCLSHRSPGPWALWPSFFAFPLCFCVLNPPYRSLSYRLATNETCQAPGF